MNWKQLKAIFWLRWRLTANQFLKAGGLSAFISLLVVVMLAMLAVAAGAGAFVGGIFLGKSPKSEFLLLACDIGILLFLFLWVIGLLSELQRSESIDLGKLLHLPISLKQVFILNYAASHASPAIIFALPVMVCFPLGVAITGGARMLLLAPVLISILLAITAWTYCLRGWLAAIMSNRRRARAITVYLTVAIVLLAQIPSLVTNSRFFRSLTQSTPHQRSRSADVPEQFVRIHMFIPPAWPGYSAMMLKQHTYLPAFVFSAAALLLAAVGLRRSYTLTMRFYTGAASGSVSASQPASAIKTLPSSRKRTMLSWDLPFLRDDTAGLTLATLRSILRAPEMKLALIMPAVVILFVFGSMVAKIKHMPEPRFVQLMLTALILIIPFSLAPTMSNVFGLDRGGFRALVLSPMRRADILFARNLAFLPFAILLSIVSLSIAGGFFHLPLTGLVTGALQTLIAFLLFAHCTNWLAILTPYRYSTNSLKAKKFKPITLLSALASMLISPLIGLIVALPALLQFFWSSLEMPGWLPVNIFVGTILLVLVCLGYWLALPVQGRLLQRREINVLAEVTSETE